MVFVQNVKRKIRQLLSTKSAVTAYDLLASTYDHQQGNLLMELDSLLVQDFLGKTDLKGRTVLDIGCGTGRHWGLLAASGAEKIIGADSSEKMLEVLRGKFPGAETFMARGSKIGQLEDQSADAIISTLTLGYIKDLKSALEEWDRLLKKGGEIILTEYHPAVLQLGGGRSFKYKKSVIHVKNYIHNMETIRMLARQLHWQETGFDEKKIDETVKAYYASQNALDTYERFKGTALIYGLKFRKT